MIFFSVRSKFNRQEIAGARAGAGVDADVSVELGRVDVSPGETLELWVGDAAGWTNNGARSASRPFSVVRTVGDSYGAGSYRTTNNCPGQAPGAQTLPGDISATIVGWDR